MLKITKPSANRLDIDLSGSIESDAMRRALDELIELSKDTRHGVMLYRITDFAMPTLGAMGVEMSRLPQLFGLLPKFKKCAVLCDTSWVRKAADIERALFPGIDIKGFDLKEAAVAEAWLAAGAK